MKKLQEAKGITLIALVITIIVLLILAGITIALITGQDSAPDKAVQARTENEKGAVKDAATMLVTEKIQGYYDGKYLSNNETAKNATSILDYLERVLTSTNAETRDGYKIVVANGKITATKTGESTAFVTGSVSTDGVITWINPVSITSISEITTTDTEVREGKTINLSVTINEDATDSVIWTSDDETVATVESSGQNTATVTGVSVGSVTITAKNADNSKSKTIEITVVEALEKVDTNTSYIGYYAYVDGIYGIIYADLLAQETRSGQWGNSNGTWSITDKSTTATDYKTYEVRAMTSSDAKFGNIDTGVITPESGTTGLDRFYIVEISNRINSVSWATACSTTAGTNDRWRLPTKAEWSMFGSAFEISSSNYRSPYGLWYGCWSSTEDSSSNAFDATFGETRMGSYSKNNESNVRLCTTF